MEGLKLKNNHITGSQDFLDANKDALATLSKEERAMFPMDTTEPTKADKKAEKDLQRDCENLLSQRDYLRMTALNAEEIVKQGATHVVRGFFGHWQNNKRNPLMPDLMVIDLAAEKRPLLVELKIEPCRWQPGQQVMCYLNTWHLCTDFAEFEIVLNAWEAE